MNKKGFTLVEVLAVIVVIGIIATIAANAILKYADEGKEDYNTSLSDELKLAGKNFFAEHKDELPTLTNGKAYAYVTLPEMQSENLVSKTFVDSEDRECSPSYVYVRQQSYDSNDYMYIPCLVCQDETGQDIKNYYDESTSPYCNISDWEDKVAPTCGNPEDITFDYNSKDKILIENVSDFKDEAKTKKGKIVAILITNTQTGEELAIYLEDEKIGSECKTAADKEQCIFDAVEKVDIKPYFKKKFKENVNGEYEVHILDEGMNASEEPCNKFYIVGPSVCEADPSENSLKITNAVSAAGFKGLYVEKEEGVPTDLHLPQKYIGKRIIQNYNLTGLTKDMIGKRIYFLDNDDNKIQCPSTIPDNPIKCTETVPGLIGLGGGKITVSCKACRGSSCADIKVGDITKIVPDSLGSINNKPIVNGNPGAATGGVKVKEEKQEIIFTIPYYPREEGVSDGISNLTLQPGVVIRQASNQTILNAEQVIKVDVDGIKPIITEGITDLNQKTPAPQITYENETENPNTAKNKKYKGTGYKDGMIMTRSCIDANANNGRKLRSFSTGKKTKNDNPEGPTKEPLMHMITYNKREKTTTPNSKCIDGAGNESTYKGKAIRVLVKGASCEACTTKEYNKCRNKAFGCEKWTKKKTTCKDWDVSYYSYTICCGSTNPNGCSSISADHTYTTSACPNRGCSLVSSAMSGTRAYAKYSCTGSNSKCSAWNYKNVKPCKLYKEAAKAPCKCKTGNTCYF